MSKLLDLIEKNAIKQSRFSNTSNTMSSSSSSGISFPGALTVLFVGLKLTNVITWSWWWVLSPIWISLSLAVVVLTIAIIIAIIAGAFK
jgi:membrane protein YdbS with pleckstrin-like domain